MLRGPSAGSGSGARVALHAHDAARARNRDPRRRGSRCRRAVAQTVRSVLVPSIWLRSWLRLALERRDDHVTGALKEGLRGVDHELGIYSQGGKGGTSRKTPVEIIARCDRLAVDPGPLIYASRMAAKVDSAAVQDGYQLYHHAFFFSGAGKWCVVQQGMSDQTRTARRYHWLSESVTSFVNEPHEAICSDVRAPTLNLVFADHEQIRNASVELAAASPDRVNSHSFRSRRRRHCLVQLRRRSTCRLVMACSSRISIRDIFVRCCSARTNGHRRISRRYSVSRAWAGGRSARWRSYPK